MGFFDKALGALVGAAAGFAVGGPGGAIAGGLGSLAPSPAAAAPVVATGIAAGVASAITPALRQSTAELAAIQAVATPGAATGFQKNITRTMVQTIAPNGTVVRSTILKGSPYLMRSDFVILKRTLGLIQDAEQLIPRPRTRGQKAAKEQAHTKGMLEGLVAASSPTQALIAHHNSHD